MKSSFFSYGKADMDAIHNWLSDFHPYDWTWKAAPDSPTTWSRTGCMVSPDGEVLAVLRMIDVKAVDNGHVAQEFRYAELAAREGVGPRMLAVNERYGMMIMEYLETVPPDTTRSRLILSVTDSLAKFHSLDSSGENLFRSKISALISRLSVLEARRTMPPLVEAAYRVFKILVTSITEESLESGKLLHGDLNPFNILWARNRPWLIDFDHSGKGDPFFDLATICLAYDVRPEETEIILKQYTGSQVTETAVAHLEFNTILVLLRYGLDVMTMHDDAMLVDVPWNVLPEAKPFLLLKDSNLPWEIKMAHLSRGFLLAAQKLVSDKLRTEFFSNFMTDQKWLEFRPLSEKFSTIIS
jgi:thiamine kinase-like enzyme